MKSVYFSDCTMWSSVTPSLYCHTVNKNTMISSLWTTSWICCVNSEQQDFAPPDTCKETISFELFISPKGCSINYILSGSSQLIFSTGCFSPNHSFNTIFVEQPFITENLFLTWKKREWKKEEKKDGRKKGRKGMKERNKEIEKERWKERKE